MSAYYNENNKHAAAWLRELIVARLIADGEVDERSITEVSPADIKGFTQAHFFAGIGGWSLALRLAGWPDDRPAWTGSCPCQPFSSAGAQVGGDDPRHLWPAWFRLIKECRPTALFGEQVAAAIQHGWLDLVFGDLEGIDYACGASVMGAHSVGAPHIRQRVWFVADADQRRWEEREQTTKRVRLQECFTSSTTDSVMANADSPERRSDNVRANGQSDGREYAGRCSETHELGHANESRPQGWRQQERADQQSSWQASDASIVEHTESRRTTTTQQSRWLSSVESTSPWSDIEWLQCRDGKSRPTQRGLFPLVNGLPRGMVPSGDPSVSYANETSEARVMRLHGYGNAINPYVAAEFIRTYDE